jgi:hypothetical protein
MKADRCQDTMLFPTLGVVYAFGCRGRADATDDSDAPVGMDADGDGYGADQGDCNDADGAVHPGALDVCDGLDNDCDGEVDEDPDRSRRLPRAPGGRAGDTRVYWAYLLEDSDRETAEDLANIRPEDYQP